MQLTHMSLWLENARTFEQLTKKFINGRTHIYLLNGFWDLRFVYKASHKMSTFSTRATVVRNQQTNKTKNQRLTMNLVWDMFLRIRQPFRHRIILSTDISGCHTTKIHNMNPNPNETIISKDTACDSNIPAACKVLLLNYHFGLFAICETLRISIFLCCFCILS